VKAEDVTAWRLFVSDHYAGKVTVVDAVANSVIETFEIKGPASLHRSNSGETVVAVQGNAGVVTPISTGIAFDDHGDHGDIEITAPKLTGVEVSGEKPSHLVEHDGEFAAFFDGEGIARILSERDALKGDLKLREVKADAPHHGVVIPFQDYDIVSVPDKEDASKPVFGAKVVDRTGSQVGETVECVGLHGEATSGNLALVGGCEDGVLVISVKGGLPTITPLNVAADMPEGRVSTILGGRGMQYFLGNYGADKVALIDPTAGDDAFRIIDLPMRRVHFAVDPVRPRFAYIFTEDGRLHRIDVIEGAISKSLALTEPYSMDGHWSDPRPRIAVAGDRIVVTDPNSGKLHLVDAASFARAGEIAIEGKPFNVVAVGGAGQTHATE